MGFYGINFRPTKEFIFSKTSQEEIMAYYTGCPVVIGTLYKSPLRNDKNPTCGYAYSGTGRLYFRDFSGHFWGDCFDLVMKLYGCDFTSCLLRICNDLHLIDLPELPRVSLRVTDNPSQEKKRKVFSFRERLKWSPTDKDYWLSYHIHSKTLRKFHVYPMYIGWIDNNIIYRYKESDPGYAYMVRMDKTNNHRMKFYFPYRDRSQARFLGNCDGDDIFGYDNLPPTGDLLIITKSLKDVMVLDEMNITSIAVQAESMTFSEKIFNDLKSRFKRIITLFDFDLAGVKLTNYFRKKFKTEFRFLTNGKFRTLDYLAKDIADLARLKGLNHTTQLLYHYL